MCLIKIEIKNYQKSCSGHPWYGTHLFLIDLAHYEQSVLIHFVS